MQIDRQIDRKLSKFVSVLIRKPHSLQKKKAFTVYLFEFQCMLTELTV